MSNRTGYTPSIPADPRPPQGSTPPASGVWAAYYSDRSGCSVFPTEIEALRFALSNCMEVHFIEYGVDVFDVDA